MLVRAATPDDVAGILAFGAEVVPEHYRPILGEQAAFAQLDWWSVRRTTDAVRAGHEWVAEDGGAIVGVCETGEFDGAYVVWKLYVRPDWRDRSVGRGLLQAAIAARPYGVQDVVLEHFAGNRDAARFYEREGFVQLRTDSAPSGDPNAATVWRSLHVEE
ncbi:GNAT family N-acetyltransferase [Allobranchiibius sp. CTAmp26]|uniref:GNAT family N-acetyltransferase n=1 Tax=Allobranchiibius sp. CTAmp26 TaxID=2815214 RepID=UPI001AA110C8|nr:GNAT family N-acetyltransferase [Allobranchiibius sp. CTAmp26]MBO1754637.1 GNAT family N-acetyltransferase [Allobranchiibius sp. CTAmp26]